MSAQRVICVGCNPIAPIAYNKPQNHNAPVGCNPIAPITHNKPQNHNASPAQNSHPIILLVW